MSTATNQTATVEAINNDYEYVQYNQHLRIIHSINDDMYQMQSIVLACQSRKPCKDWFRNQSSQEIIDEINKMTRRGNPPLEKTYEKRDELPINLRGYYVHRLLVNHIAMWASPRYAVYIMKLLDSTFERERQQLTDKIAEQQPRMVPMNREGDYKYLIWKEATNDDETTLHLVRRHKSNFRQIIRHYNDDNERWFFKDNLPIVMTPNKDIKELVKRSFGDDDYHINSCEIRIKTHLLERLHTIIDEYFNTFQS